MNGFRMLVVLTALFSMISMSAQATTYYVSVNGDDILGTGTLVSPLRTVGHVNGMELLPGDNVRFKRGDVFNESLVISTSGLKCNHIYFGSYGIGDKPIVGNGLVGVDLVGANYITVDGLDVRGWSDAGIRILGGNGFTLERNHVTGGTGSSFFGIYVEGVDGVSIADNELNDIGVVDCTWAQSLGDRRGIFVNASLGARIDRNVLNSIGGGAIRVDDSPRAVARDNYMENFVGGIGWFNTDDGLIQGNTIVHGCGSGVGIAYGSDRTIVRSVYIDDLTQSGISSTGGLWNGIDISNLSNDTVVEDCTVLRVVQTNITIENLGLGASTGTLVQNNHFDASMGRVVGGFDPYDFDVNWNTPNTFLVDNAQCYGIVNRSNMPGEVDLMDTVMRGNDCITGNIGTRTGIVGRYVHSMPTVYDYLDLEEWQDLSPDLGICEEVAIVAQAATHPGNRRTR